VAVCVRDEVIETDFYALETSLGGCLEFEFKGVGGMHAQ
jgi:hypothetical protein